MESNDSRTRAAHALVLAWLVTSIFYFYQNAMRSAPAVIVRQLSYALGMSVAGRSRATPH